MKNKIEILKKLDEVLSHGIPAQIMECASTQNNWFRACDISAAVDAIREQMLKCEKIEAWMAKYPTLPTTQPEDILVVMAGNIPLVGFFDLLCVFMAGHRAHIKCSSKDRVVMEYVISVMKEIDSNIAIYIGDFSAPHRVIATGGESAVRHFKAQYTDIPTLLRGSRHSIAVLTSQQRGDIILEDIYMYSGLGCRNVSMVFIPKGSELNIPRYDTHPLYHSNYLQNRALQTMKGVTFDDNGSSILIRSNNFPSSLTSISISEYETIEEVEMWIKEHNEELQCIVSDIISHPRCVGFGESQRPTLNDYADAVDTMKFLI
ncbi:MAG: aldehyde dehydrogenase [Rikenellaceae bacterium]